MRIKKLIRYINSSQLYHIDTKEMDINFITFIKLTLNMLFLLKQINACLLV